MKKKILSLAFVAVSLIGFNGIAKTSDNLDNNVKIEQTSQKSCDKKMKKTQKRQAKNSFEGLNLTEAQKSSLEQLDKTRREKMMTAKKERKAEDKKIKNERRLARKAEKKEYLEQVKSIIGPEQYVIFLENAYVNNGGNHSVKAMSQKHKASKMQKGAKMQKSGKSKRGEASMNSASKVNS
ncbi:MAG: hypothetical protein HDS71_00920 [Bacteroidales bacterium]|nr:hypothetical protein [Bacteroidales bacterium]MBD5222608.1 hypothetical protein [Bacteroidales bacterium]